MAKTKPAATELTDAEAPEAAPVAVVAAPAPVCRHCTVSMRPRGDDTFYCPSCFTVGLAAHIRP